MTKSTADSMSKLLPPFLFTIIYLLSYTLRLRIDDKSGISKGVKVGPVVWAAWHNRILMLPLAFKRFFPERLATVLTSSSKDGALLSSVMTCFGLQSVRGSSSSRGSAALRELASVLKGGRDIVLTPDGPRGPAYILSPGVIKLAQMSGSSIIPLHVHYSRFWTLKSWDGFRIPKPFSRVLIVIGALHKVENAAETEDATHSGKGFEVERARLETVLADGMILST